jgi:hypothetical protein
MKSCEATEAQKRYDKTLQIIHEVSWKFFAEFGYFPPLVIARHS